MAVAGQEVSAEAEVVSRHLSAENLLSTLRARRAKLSRGTDRVDVVTFERTAVESLNIVCRKLNAGTFKFSPYLEKLVSKGRGRPPRLIARPTVRDKLVLWGLKDVLHELLPEMVPSELPNQVVRAFVAELSANKGCSVIRVDILAFYDQIDRAILLQRLGELVVEEKIVALVKSSISCPIVPPGFRKDDLSEYVSKDGVPQGLPTSNFLANLYLSDFDNRMKSAFGSYFRYVDDMLVVVNEQHVGAVTSLVDKLLGEIGLTVNKNKSKAYRFDEQFEFLGYEVVSGKVRPKKASLDKYLRSLAALFNGLKRRALPRRGTFSTWSDWDFAELFVAELNELIAGAISKGRQYGWVFYFNEANDLTPFALADTVIRRFARRTDLLTNDQRSRIKRCIRAVHETRHSKGAGYVKNYDRIETPADKLAFLKAYGYLDRHEVLGLEAVEMLYEKTLEDRLNKLEKDIGFIS